MNTESYNYNHWEITDKIKQNGRYYYQCECKCGCGEQRLIRTDTFNSRDILCKTTKEKKKKPKPIRMNREEYKTRLKGCRFGKLAVVDFYGYNKNKQIIYKCICDCGNEVYVSYSDLKSNKKDSCGCLTSYKMSAAKRKFNTYDLSHEYGIGYTTNTNRPFYFDLEDYDKIKNYCWFEHDGYIVSRDPITFKDTKLHRVVMNTSNPNIKIDHIKHNLFDNRKSQLRMTTNQENCFNHVIHSNNTSGVTGVGWDKEKNKWRSRIFIEGKGIQLGYFEKFEDAVEARRNAEEKYFGKFSYDNSMNTEGV